MKLSSLVCALIIQTCIVQTGAGCSSRDERVGLGPVAAPAIVAPGPAASASNSSALVPLQGEWLVPLRDGRGRSIGVVAVPLGANAKERVIVAAHAAVSRANWLCSTLRTALGPRGFIICPHSSEDNEQSSSWQSAEQLRQRTYDAVEAVQGEFGAYVDLSRVTFFGHSQGAMTLPYAFAKPGPIHWGTVVFFEGLPREPERVPAAVRAMGADQVLLVSGQPGWEPGHRALADRLTRDGLAASHIAGNFGHYARPEQIRTLLGTWPERW
jgi:predicted esterase